MAENRRIGLYKRSWNGIIAGNRYKVNFSDEWSKIIKISFGNNGLTIIVAKHNSSLEIINPANGVSINNPDADYYLSLEGTRTFVITSNVNSPNLGITLTAI